MSEVEPRFKSEPGPKRRRSFNSSLPAASKRVNPISGRRRAQIETLKAIRPHVIARAGGRCQMPDGHHVEGCNGQGTDLQHLRPRSLVTDDSLSNLIWLNHHCHMWAEEHPIEATRLGVSRIGHG